MPLTNCWDIIKCGAAKVASCPAPLQKAGRKCWLVAGTFSGGQIACDHALKLKSCKECDFYKSVKTATA
jgi:hypothetical protein